MSNKSYVPSPWQEESREPTPVSEPTPIKVCLSMRKEDWQNMMEALDTQRKHYEDAGLATEANALSSLYTKVREQSV